MLPKRCQRRSKGRPKNMSKMLIDFSSILIGLGLRKGGPKSGLCDFFGIPFRVLGATWLQKGAVGRPDPIFGAFLTIFPRFLSKQCLIS